MSTLAESLRAFQDNPTPLRSVSPLDRYTTVVCSVTRRTALAPTNCNENHCTSTLAMSTSQRTTTPRLGVLSLPASGSLPTYLL